MLLSGGTCTNNSFISPHAFSLSAITAKASAIALRRYLNTKSAHEDYKQKLISLLKQYNIQVTDIDKQAAQIYYIASKEPNGYDPNVVLCAKAVAELKTELEFSEYMIQQSMVKILSEYNKEGE